LADSTLGLTASEEEFIVTKPKILVTEALGPKGLAFLREHADVDAHDLLPNEQLPELMGQYDAVIIRSAHRLTRELMSGHARLKVVARAGAGVDNVDLTAATELGLAVINAPGANAIAAARTHLWSHAHCHAQHSLR